MFIGHSFLGSLWSLGCFTRSCWSFTCTSLSENLSTWGGLATLLLFMPVEIFLELGHCHLIGGLGRFLSTWRWVSWETLLLTSSSSLGRCFTGSWDWLGLLWGFFSASWFVGSVFNDLVNALSDISGGSTLDGLLGSRLGSGLLLSLGTTLNLWCSLLILNFLKSIFTFFLDKDVLDLENGSVALLEWEVYEFVTLGSTALNNTTFYFNFFAGSISTRELWDIWKWLLF